jgi:hypothetical protein
MNTKNGMGAWTNLESALSISPLSASRLSGYTLFDFTIDKFDKIILLNKYLINLII